MRTCLLLLLLLCTGLTPALAQPTWTFHDLDVRDPDRGPQSRLPLLGGTPGDYVLANGRRANWFIPPDRTQPPEPLLCTIAGFTREPTGLRQGALFEGLNSLRVVVGNDDGYLADNVRRLVGIVRQPSGDCEAYRYPGAGNTSITDVDEAGNQVGWYDTPLPRNLARFHGFLRQADGTLLSFNGLGADSILFPEGLKGGRVTGYALTQFNADTNGYVYTAFVCEWTDCLPLKDPNGQNLWIPAHNEAGYAIAMTANGQRTVGGQPWLIHLPTKTFWPIAGPTVAGYTLVGLTVRGIDALGRLYGTYTLRQDGCVVTPTSQCDTTHAYLAVPDGPLPVPASGPKKTKWRHLLEWWASKHEQLHDWHDHDADDPRWKPVWKDGKVVLKRGEEVRGE